MSKVTNEKDTQAALLTLGNMDTLAKAYWPLCHRQNTPVTQQVRNDEWAIGVDNEKI
jgi:hypothetical protein